MKSHIPPPRRHVKPPPLPPRRAQAEQAAEAANHQHILEALAKNQHRIVHLNSCGQYKEEDKKEAVVYTHVEIISSPRSIWERLSSLFSSCCVSSKNVDYKPLHPLKPK